MRVTGGRFAGMRVKARGRGMRPTPDRVRESLFAILGGTLQGARVADLFAGSGILGIEAYSRGAAEVIWVDEDAGACRVIRENVARICGTEAAAGVVRSDVLRWLKCHRGGRFDLILCDPPYRKVRVRENALRSIARGDILRPAGLVVLEGPAGGVPAAEMLETVRRMKYGETEIAIFRRPVPDED